MGIVCNATKAELRKVTQTEFRTEFRSCKVCVLAEHEEDKRNGAERERPGHKHSYE